MADMKDRDGSQRRSKLATLWLLACVAAGLLLAAPAAVQIFGLAPGGQAEASGRRTVNVGDVRVDGRTVNIEDVRAGDTVWAYDTAAGEWRPARVVRPQTHLYEGDVVTVSGAGQKIEATGNHPFWVAEGHGLSGRPPAEDVGAHERGMQADGRWVEARHLQPGDLLLLRNGELATVEELATRRQKLKVYNIEVADLHTYAVGGAGVLVHNKAMSADGPMPSGSPPEVPRFVYRSGGKNPGAFKTRGDEAGPSFRDSISDPYPQPETGPVMRSGEDIQIIDTQKLPEGSQVRTDGAPNGPNAPGHVTVVAPPQGISGAVVDTIRPGRVGPYNPGGVR